MIFTPQKNFNLWDTWLVYHHGLYYLYYLTLAPDFSNIPGFCLATSPDGVHWTEMGLVLSKHDDAQWLGTGSIWKSETFEQDGRFIVNFSEWRGPTHDQGQQTIFLADSTDLIHWRRLGAEFEFAPDARWYRTGEGIQSRWDCIYTIPRPGGGRYGYWTANPKTVPMGFGFGEAPDGVHWRALPPPAIEWGDCPAMSKFEVGAVERIGSRYYMLVSGFLLDDGQGGTLTFVADKPEGPFRPAPVNFRLLTSSTDHYATYFARFFPAPDGLLIHHHSIDRQKQVSFAPLKRAVIDGAGTLRLAYWEGNDRLKAHRIPLSLSPVGPQRLGVFDPILDSEKGVILEGTLALPSEADREPRGLYFENTSGSGDGILVYAGGVTEFGLVDSAGNNFQRKDGVDRAWPHSGTVRFRLLWRRTFVELYLDDILTQCYNLTNNPTGRIGWLGNPDAVRNTAAWSWSAG